MVQLDSPIISATATYQQILILASPSPSFFGFQRKECLQCHLHQVLRCPHLLFQILAVICICSRHSGGGGEGRMRALKMRTDSMLSVHLHPTRCTGWPELFPSVPSRVRYFDPSLLASSIPSDSHAIYFGPPSLDDWGQSGL